MIRYLVQNIAIAQKINEGHNVRVEVGFTGDEHNAAAAITSVLKKIDHKALGLDVDLGFEPELTRLCPWVFQSLKESGLDSLIEVRMVRGDGVSCRFPTDRQNHRRA